MPSCAACKSSQERSLAQSPPSRKKILACDPIDCVGKSVEDQMKRKCWNIPCHRPCRYRRTGVEEIDMGAGRPSRIIHGRVSGANRKGIAIVSLSYLHQIELVYRGFADSWRYAVGSAVVCVVCGGE